LASAIRYGEKQGIEEGLKQGLERGRRRGLKQGLAQGLEQGLEQGRATLIHTLRELNIPDAQIITKLMDKYNMTTEEAEEQLRLYN
jgi:flagellar biosynthesis/type III secretory pathway protein FliH